MSTIERPIDVPVAPATETHAEPLGGRVGLNAGDGGPTMSIYRVLVILAIALGLGLLLGAKGIVHAGHGMAEGPERTVTLAIGNAALSAAQTLDLTWPWDRIEAALGRSQQPAVPPLLAGNKVPRTKYHVPSRHVQPGPPGKAGSGAASKAPPGPTPPGPVRASGPGARHPGARSQPAHRSPCTRWWRHRCVAPHWFAVRWCGWHPHRCPPPPWRAPFQPSSTRPLRLLVTGDSLSDYLGPELVNEAAAVGPVLGFTDSHDGTGLTRPDFVDWSVVAQQQVAADAPDAVVVIMGGNDFQNMITANGSFLQAGSPAWTAEYQRRAAVCMRIWTQGGSRRVYWLSIPPARDPGWANIDAHINAALQRAAASVRGAEFVNILGPVTNHGHYSDYVMYNGQPTLIREPDGVHLNMVGSTIVANEVLGVIKREWRLGYRPHMVNRRRHRTTRGVSRHHAQRAR